MSGTAAESASPAELAFTPDYRRYVLRSAFASLESAGREKVALGAKLQTEFVLDQSSWASADELIASFATRNGVDWLTAATDLEELSNRLQAVGAYPNSVTGFRWDASEAELTSLAGEVVARSQRVLDGIAALKPGEHTFTNTLQALNDNDRIVDLWSTCVSFPGHVSASKAIRDVSTALSKSLSEFEVSQSMRVDLYDSFKAFSETAEAKALKGEAARLLEFTLRDLRRNGLHLPLEQRQRVEAIKKRMSNLGIEFGKNLGEENAKFEFTKEQLEGVPEDQMQRWKKAGAEDTYVVSLKYPDYFPCMELCSVEATRAQLEKAYNSRCMAENVPILEELVRLRAEQASILGYPTHAAYVLETRMAKSPDVVGPFLTNLSKRLTPLMEEELAYWRELKTDEKKKRGETIPEGGVAIEAYDVRYYSRLSELLKYKVDDQAIKRYFPIEVVTAGLLQIFQTAFGLVFEELTGGDRPAHSVWHEEVQLFRVKDADTQKLRGYFYLDLYPREGKYGHAAVWGLKAGCQNLTAEGGRQLPVAGMVCNFTKATADQPSLLQHSEVNTYFHEFGHVMHGLCSEVTYQRFAGTAVERDFVEAPSQMLENWVYEKEPLLMMSGYVDDKTKKIPQEMIDALANSKKANAGIFNKRQCILGLFDQHIHTHPEADTASVWNEVNAANWPIKPTPGTNFAAGFGHLAGGYDSQYYGYIWSEVYSSDLFASRWLKEGLLNPQTGLDYRREVISRGGSVDATEMLRNFLGREPNDVAFLKSKGLSVE